MIYENSKANIPDYLSDHCNPINCIPESATLNEAVFFLMEDNIRTYNDMMMDLALNELSVLESTGQEVVYEGSAIKDLGNKAVAAATQIWNTFQGYVQKAQKLITAKAEEFKKTVIDKITGKVDIEFLRDRVDPNKKYGETYEYNFKLVSDIAGALSKGGSKLVTEFRVAEGAEEKKDFNKTVKEIVDEAKANASGSKSMMSSKFVEGIKDRIRGQKVTRYGKWVIDNFNSGDNILGEVKGYAKTRQQIKDAYNETKKIFNQTIKDMKGECKDKKEFKSSLYSSLVSGLNKLLNATSTAESASISLAYERYNFYRKIAIQVIGRKATGKKEKENPKSKNESAISLESTTFDRVSSLFEW